MMSVVYLLVLVLLAKIVLIDSPLGRALGDAIRNLVPQKAAEGAVSQAEFERLRLDMEQLQDQVERVAEEQAFLTRLLSEPQRLSLGPGEIQDPDTRR